MATNDEKRISYLEREATRLEKEADDAFVVDDAAAWAAAILDALHLLHGVCRWQAGLAGARRRLDAERLDLVATCERLLRAVRDEAAAALPEARAEIHRDPAGWAMWTIDAAKATPKRGDGRGRATHVIEGTIGPEGIRLDLTVAPRRTTGGDQPRRTA
jgi:hypothetical protein